MPDYLVDNTSCGLRNLTNTCYANAAINAVAKLPRCRICFANQRHCSTHQTHPPDCLLCALAHDVATLTTLPANEPFRPQSVLRRASWNDARSFDNFRQHDANEAFQALMTACDAVDLNAFRGLHSLPALRDHDPIAYTTPHWKIFGALTKETKRCRSCPRVVENHALHASFTVSVPEEGTPRIEDIFRDAMGQEDLDADARCEHCQRSGCLFKETVLMRMPDVLVLRLKRWTYNAATHTWDKIPTKVCYETLLPLSVDAIYDLRSVIVHHGAAGGGHYTSFVRAQDNRWYHCNDELTPEPCSTERALAAQAYMLLYERR